MARTHSPPRSDGHHSWQPHCVGRAVAVGRRSRGRACYGWPRQFLIPGLWDMHVHTAVIGGREFCRCTWRTASRACVTWRATGRRSQRCATNSQGRLVGPRIVASGPYLEGGDVPIPHILARTPEEARAGVDSLARLGVDFVKVHANSRARPTSPSRGARASVGLRSRDTCRAWSDRRTRPTRASAASSTCWRFRPRARRPSRWRFSRAFAVQARSAAARRGPDRVVRALRAERDLDYADVHRPIRGRGVARRACRAIRSRVSPDRCGAMSRVFPMPDSIPPGADPWAARCSRSGSRRWRQCTAPACGYSPVQTRRCATARPGSAFTRSWRCWCAAGCRRSRCCAPQRWSRRASWGCSIRQAR